MQIANLVLWFGQVLGPGQLLAINPDCVVARGDCTDHVIIRMIANIDNLFGRDVEAFSQMLVNQRVRFGNLQLRSAYRMFDQMAESDMFNTGIAIAN